MTYKACMDEKRINIKIPEDLHTQFKILSVKKKTTMKDMIIEFMKKAVGEDTKE
jgi:ParG